MNIPQSKENTADVAIIMGSKSDFDVMKESSELLTQLKISFITKIISAHRTPERLYSFSKTAKKNGIKIIIAGAGGAAHLPGMVASLAHVPVIGVPIKSRCLNGIDSLLSIVQMPKGVPVGTMAIGSDGAYNAAIMAALILSISDSKIYKNLETWYDKQSSLIKEDPY